MIQSCARQIFWQEPEKKMFSWFYLFGFGSVVSQDGEGEKIGNRPTHPGELVYPRSIRVQRMRRHTTTFPHCKAEDDEKRETRKRTWSEKS